MRAHKFLMLLLPLAAFFLAHCGVKGDPVAPEIPPVIGNGHPTVKRVYKKSKADTQDDDNDDNSDN